MKTASLKELKNEFENLTREEAIALCVRLAKFKKDNKELLTYLLFEANDEAGYIESIKEEVTEEFRTMKKYSPYVAKKGIQRILRILKKYIRYSGNKETEVELLLFFCQRMKKSGIRLRSSRVIWNIYQRQLTTIEKGLNSMHEDLRYDYEESLRELID